MNTKNLSVKVLTERRQPKQKIVFWSFHSPRMKDKGTKSNQVVADYEGEKELKSEIILINL